MHAMLGQPIISDCAASPVGLSGFHCSGRPAVKPFVALIAVPDITVEPWPSSTIFTSMEGRRWPYQDPRHDRR